MGIDYSVGMEYVGGDMGEMGMGMGGIGADDVTTLSHPSSDEASSKSESSVQEYGQRPVEAHAEYDLGGMNGGMRTGRGWRLIC